MSIIVLIEIIIIGLKFLIPYLSEKIINRGAITLTQRVLPTEMKTPIEVPYYLSESEKPNYNYGISSWVYIHPEPLNTNEAYLENTILEPSSSPYLIELVPGNYSLIAYVRNIVDGSLSSNNTAYNVSLNWTLPSEIQSLFNYTNLTLFNEVLNDTSRQYLNITLNLDSSNIVNLNIIDILAQTYFDIIMFKEKRSFSLNKIWIK